MFFPLKLVIILYDMKQECNEKKTRVSLYADLRDKISKMDTLSLIEKGVKDEQKPSNNTLMPEIHSQTTEINTNSTKKNTLSISIDEIMKQNDDYTMMMEKKEIDKKYNKIKGLPITKKQLSIIFLILLGLICISIIVTCIVLLLRGN